MAANKSGLGRWKVALSPRGPTSSRGLGHTKTHKNVHASHCQSSGYGWNGCVQCVKDTSVAAAPRSSARRVSDFAASSLQFEQICCILALSGLLGCTGL
eukprot:scaffold190205_cov15-Tisochrysis_lutea.AAC.1